MFNLALQLHCGTLAQEQLESENMAANALLALSLQQDERQHREAVSTLLELSSQDAPPAKIVTLSREDWRGFGKQAQPSFPLIILQKQAPPSLAPIIGTK
eukprot:73943-Rhodomonas_salina.1